nr:alpha/beta hydrolase [Streptomyces spiramenti]
MRSVRSATTVRRVLTSLAVVLAVLLTSGWLHRNETLEPGGQAGQLQAWRQDTITGTDLPDPLSGPEVVADFFASLGHRKQFLLAERHPLVVGNLGGAPAEVRYAANRHALAAAREREQTRSQDRRLSPVGRHESSRRAHRLSSLLAEGRQILAFDPTGSGRVAEVVGDLDEAERVSVVVPGVDTDLLTFERTRLRYRAPVGMAHALYAQQREADPGRRTAVIAWADYTAPRGVKVSAATAGPAEEGARRLTATVAALPGDATVALFCHSYGSVVCGLAASDLPKRVTDIAVAGSPGMRAAHAGELGTRARIWAARSPADWIRDVPHLAVGPLGHGPDPADPAFGALPVAGEDVPGHGGYFLPGTDSLTAFGRIGAGLVDRAARGGEGPYCVPRGLPT